MDRQTAAVYERQASEWTAGRGPGRVHLRRLATFASQLDATRTVADLGCGPGWYGAALARKGARCVSLDLSRAMLREARSRSESLPLLRADLGALPFARGSLAGAWAMNTYGHLPETELPVAFAHLHASVATGGRVELTLPNLDVLRPNEAEIFRGFGKRRLQNDPFAGRLFTALRAERARALLLSAGFDQVEVEIPVRRRKGRGPDRFWLWIRARRAYSLPDFVRVGLRLLICGLNPSLHAADCGIPFSRPGNRFWPAALRAGLAQSERDPWSSLQSGLGFTDLVKRPTRAANELDASEYADGIARVEDCVRWSRPRAICFVGLDGWRRAVDSAAKAGWIPGGFAGRPAYLMPSTSGRNAHVDLAKCATHLRRAARGPRSRIAGDSGRGGR